MLGGTTKKPFEADQYQCCITNIYFDNVLLEANSVQDALGMYLDSTEIFKRVPMNLREWILNPLKFLNLLPKSRTAKGNRENAFSIPWNYTEAKFTYVEDSLTKRG